MDATDKPAEVGTSDGLGQPLAWMHPDGRVVPAATMASALRDGGAMRSSLTGYTIPLYRRAALAAERERCAKPVPDEWLVKVRRLVQGFEHVSGIARLWEPDYSSGSDRALWARATEACADVAKLLREYEGPNVLCPSLCHTQ